MAPNDMGAVHGDPDPEIMQCTTGGQWLGEPMRSNSNGFVSTRCDSTS